MKLNKKSYNNSKVKKRREIGTDDSDSQNKRKNALKNLAHKSKEENILKITLDVSCTSKVFPI